jgi:phage tail-like protein
MTKNDPSDNAVLVNHVADTCLHYPGDTVTFYTRLKIDQAMSNLTLRISLPRGLELAEYHAPTDYTAQVPRVEVTEEANYLVWTPDYGLPTGSQYEFETQAVIGPIAEDVTLTSLADVMDGDEVLSLESATLAIRAKGQYLQYLPAVFERDELMGRFLMLFESFWQPIEGQIDAMPYYFDPRTTPAGFLPWLASWLDLDLDERWSEAQVRQLIRWAIALHRSRGTKWGLLKYLEIYTGQRAKVIEQISNNFVLGPDARLGPAIALGRGNRPHTFTVNLRLPEPDPTNAPEKTREEKLIRRTVESIIDMQKPAHTLYTLDLAFVPPGQLEAGEPDISETATVTEVDEITAQAATWFKLDDE